MSAGTFVLPAGERALLAFEQFTARLDNIEPDRARLFPEAVIAAGDWIVEGEDVEDFAAVLVDGFLGLLAAMEREMRDRRED